MYNLNLPPEILTNSDSSISIEEVEDIFLELSDNGCIVQFTSSNRSKNGEYLMKTLPYIPGLRQDLQVLNNSLLDITIFSNNFEIKECFLQKIIYRLYQMDIVTLFCSPHISKKGYITLKCTSVKGAWSRESPFANHPLLGVELGNSNKNLYIYINYTYANI